MASMKTPQPPAGAPPGSPAAGDSAESLRLRVRQLEANHRDWQDQVQKDLRRQKLELDTLRRDNEQYKQELNELRATEMTTAIGSGSLRNPQSKTSRRSKELEVKRETLARLEARVRAEQARLQDAERQIDEVRGMTRMARRTMGGVNVTADTHAAVQRQVTVLENRLDQSLVQFNDALRKNKDLRDSIDTLRGERDVFQAIYQKLETELQEKKKEMAFIIEVSNIAYEERDNNVQVLANLKAFAEEEMQSFAETFKELDDLLEEDRKMKEQVKARLAALQKKDGRDEDGKSKRKGTANAAKQPTTVSSAEVKDATTAQVQAYEEAFFKIKQATDIPDLSELVDRFLHSEEDNFSLFSYVNDLSKEIEALERGRNELLKDIENVSLGNGSEQERRQALKKLEEALRGEESKSQKFVELTLKTEGILRGAMTSVEHIFNRLDCDESIILEQHGVSGLTLETLLLYLAAIELRTDEYLVSWSKQNGALIDGFGAPRGPQVPFDAMQVTVDPKRLPGTGEDAEGSDDDDHPLTREEILRKIQKKTSAQALAAAERKMVRGGKPKTIGLGPKK